MTKILDDRYLEEWLAQEDPEKVLDPELPIVDPHHHLWDLRKITFQPQRFFTEGVFDRRICQ